MNRRRNEGAETFARLLDWTRGQAAAERLAVQLLRVEGFKSLDPSHPLGGPDGLKDVLCQREGKRWIGGIYFPRGQRTIGKIKEKLKQDLSGVEECDADGFAFVTNQELRLSERDELRNLVAGTEIELLHLERIASILDSPECYGIRLEFLDIEMTKEEQTAFIAARDALIDRLQDTLASIVSHLRNPDLLKSLSAEHIRANIPLSEIKEFKSILDSIAGYNPYVLSFGQAGHIRDLQVPLRELREFVEILDRITGHQDSLTSISSIALFGSVPGHVSQLHVPLADLKEFEKTLDRIAGHSNVLRAAIGHGQSGHVRDLNVPVNELRQYETTLDRILEKLREKKLLES